MVDNDECDEKIISVCINDPSMNCYNDLHELPQHLFDEITHFFTVYKTLENKETVVTEICGAEEAKNVIQQSIDMYDDIYLR